MPVFEAAKRLQKHWAELFAKRDLVRPCETSGSAMSRRVYLAELEQIHGSRGKRGLESAGELGAYLEDARAKPAGDDYFAPPVEANLLGLALSGGGIRSATFCLGVLQVLGERGVLRFADYLSTVSGGGYIGSFWTCFLARSEAHGKPLADWEENGSRPFQRNPLYKLTHEVGKEESVTFQRLRNFANYLVVGGLWNTIRGPAVILRGLIVNFLMVLPYVLLLSALVAWVFEAPIADNRLGWTLVSGLPSPLWPWALGLAFLVAIVLSTVLQSLYQRGGEASAAWRERLFHVVMMLILISLGVAWIDLQPKLLFALYCTEANPGCEPAGASFLFDGEFWSALSAAFGTASAALAGVMAARATELKGKLVLGAVGVLVPLSFLFLHFLLTAWSALGVPASVRLPAWLVSDYLTPQGYLLVGLALLAVSAVCFDVNATSLHNFYRDSLSRTFLFSLHEDRDRSATEREDDLKLSQVDIRRSGGPYHLINATVNNPNLEDTALRGRRSDFFVFGAAYSGNNRLGYCRTRSIERADASANLGTALAVSAAALAPNMGEKTKPILTFLLAMLNLRLGYWLPSPIAATSTETRLLKTVGPAYFFAEMLNLGSKNRRERYVNLSDGGHIENLGIFELLRRRCRFIIAVDSEADRDLTFNGLATVIRLARTDMGVDIDIDLEDLRKDAAGLSRRHWVLGRIDYGDAPRGALLYIKSSLTGSENEYITEYRSRNADFPHQTTNDQFFDEVQFEAYRALGYKVGNSIFPRRQEPAGSPAEIFARLAERDTGAVRRTDDHLKLLDRRRSIDGLLADPDLEAYAREILPEPAAKGRRGSKSKSRKPAQPQPPTVKLHQVCNAQLQLMEHAVLALRLDDPRNRTRRSNRGWMNLFRSWGGAPTFQGYLAADIDTYSLALKTFCHEALGLSPGAAGGAGPEPTGPRHLIDRLSRIHGDAEANSDDSGGGGGPESPRPEGEPDRA